MRSLLLSLVMLLIAAPLIGNAQQRQPLDLSPHDFPDINALRAALSEYDDVETQEVEYLSHEPEIVSRDPFELYDIFTDSSRELDWINLPDDRVRISPAVSEIVLLAAIYDQDEMYCTGSFIGPNVLLTAAHCIYHLDYGWPNDVIAFPGQDGNVNPLGYSYASYFYIPTPYANSGDNLLDSVAYDFGVLTFDTNIGNTSGWLTLGILPDATLLSSSLNPITIGYPGDKPIGTQWGAPGPPLLEIDDSLLVHLIDNWSGQSGSPIMRGSDGAVFGLISTDIEFPNGDRFSFSPRVSHMMVGFIDDVCTEANCTFSAFEETAPPPPSDPNPPPPPPPPSDPNPPPPPPPPSDPNPPAPAAPVGSFQTTWARTDQPVAQGQANRTWMWGPTPFTGTIYEEYRESPGQQRAVQYFDKSRMEITNPNGDAGSIWFVTNGLLVNELITGNMQVGDNNFTQRQPANVNVAGDADDPTGPTYATFRSVMNASPNGIGLAITQTIDRSGTVSFDPAFINQGVTAAHYVPETNHAVASVFWDFMNSEGTVYEGGSNFWAPLFINPFYATGYPITEAYWATVKVGGVYQTVLIQVFERRVLTYTPGNSAGWQVEAGNVGRHYYEWRYVQLPNPEPEPTEEPFPTETPDINAEMPPFSRGQIGTQQKTPLGRENVSPLSEQYLAIPSVDKDKFGWTVLSFGKRPSMPTYVNVQKAFSLVNNSPSPSGEIVYVIDFGDGSVYVGGIIKNNTGINVPHTYLGEGSFTIRAWTIDPHEGIRTLVTVDEVVVEKQ